LLYKTQNIAINGFDISIRNISLFSGTGGVPTFTGGSKKTMGFRGYTRDAQITITANTTSFFNCIKFRL
jgi:hypothetical protein